MEIVVSGIFQQRTFIHKRRLQVVVHVVESGTRFRGCTVPFHLRRFHVFIDFAPVRLLLQARVLLRRDFRVQFRGHGFPSFRCNWLRRLGWELLTLCCSILLVFSHFGMRNVLLLLPLSPTVLELEDGKRRVMTVKYAKKTFSMLKLTQILTCWDERSRNKKFLIVRRKFSR